MAWNITHLIQDINENKICCSEIQLSQKTSLQVLPRDRLWIIIATVDERCRIADLYGKQWSILTVGRGRGHDCSQSLVQMAQVRRSIPVISDSRKAGHRRIHFSHAILINRHLIMRLSSFYENPRLRAWRLCNRMPGVECV
jgi:hypothetical protein